MPEDPDPPLPLAEVPALPPAARVVPPAARVDDECVDEGFGDGVAVATGDAGDDDGATVGVARGADDECDESDE